MSTNNKMYNITLTKHQLQLISDACRMMTFVGLGDAKELAEWVIRSESTRKSDDNPNPYISPDVNELCAIGSSIESAFDSDANWADGIETDCFKPVVKKVEPTNSAKEFFEVASTPITTEHYIFTRLIDDNYCGIITVLDGSFASDFITDLNLRSYFEDRDRGKYVLVDFLEGRCFGDKNHKKRFFIYGIDEDGTIDPLAGYRVPTSTDLAIRVANEVMDEQKMYKVTDKRTLKELLDKEAEKEAERDMGRE